MSINLSIAIDAIIKAIQDNDLDLVFELTTVKSLISGCLTGDRPFSEDNKYNVKHLGKTIYEYLDNMNYDYAVKCSKIPAGVSVITGNEISSGGLTVRSEHPVIQRIQEEVEYCWNLAQKKYGLPTLEWVS
jgi:hypothetical protein